MPVMKDQLGNNLQEEILHLLCWSDKHCATLAELLEPEHFSSQVFWRTAESMIEYFRQYRKPPGVHIEDCLETRLAGDDGAQYQGLASQLLNTEIQVNHDYVMDQFSKFSRSRQLITAAQAILKHVNRDKLEMAEQEITDMLTTKLSSLDLGERFFDDPEKTMDFVTDISTSMYTSGIPAFDMLGVRPARGEGFAVVAPPNVGKTAFCVRLGTANVMCGHRVLHAALESTKSKVKQRYTQAFCGAAQSLDQFQAVNQHFIVSATNGSLTDIKNSDVEVVKFLDDEQDVHAIKNFGTRHRDRFRNLIIKKFPRDYLTIGKLRAYIEQLINIEHFSPDIVIIDYPELMKHANIRDFRVAIGQTIVGLLGLADIYKFALVIPWQANRESLGGVFWITGKHLSEDYSILKHVDNMITLNQEEAEYQLGLIRAQAIKVRDGAKRGKVVIATNFSMGQFCVDSIIMRDDTYKQVLKTAYDIDLKTKTRRKNWMREDTNESELDGGN